MSQFRGRILLPAICNQRRSSDLCLAKSSQAVRRIHSQDMESSILDAEAAHKGPQCTVPIPCFTTMSRTFTPLEICSRSRLQTEIVVTTISTGICLLTAAPRVICHLHGLQLRRSAQLLATDLIQAKDKAPSDLMRDVCPRLEYRLVRVASV